MPNSLEEPRSSLLRRRVLVVGRRSSLGEGLVDNTCRRAAARSLVGGDSTRLAEGILAVGIDCSPGRIREIDRTARSGMAGFGCPAEANLHLGMAQRRSVLVGDSSGG